MRHNKCFYRVSSALIFQSANAISIKYIVNDLEKFGVNIREITNYFIDFVQGSLMLICSST